MWTYLPYGTWTRELSTWTRELRSLGTSGGGGYRSSFVADYVDHLDNGVLPMIAKVRKDVNVPTTTIEEVLLATASETPPTVAKRLRIHDVLAKSAYDEIRHIVLEQLPGYPLDSYSGMSNGMPLFALQFILWRSNLSQKGAKYNKIAIGVQIQGYEYRRFIDKNFDGSWKYPAPSSSNPLYDWAIKHWMLATDSSQRFPFGSLQIQAMQGRKAVAISGQLPTGHEPFKFSADRFRYLRIKIPHSCTVDCVVTELIRDLVMLAGKLYKSNGWPTIQACSCGPSDSEPRIEAGIAASPRSEPVRGIPAESSERVRAAEHSWPADFEESEPFSLAKKAVENWGKS